RSPRPGRWGSAGGARCSRGRPAARPTVGAWAPSFSLPLLHLQYAPVQAHDVRPAVPVRRPHQPEVPGGVGRRRSHGQLGNGLAAVRERFPAVGAGRRFRGGGRKHPALILSGVLPDRLLRGLTGSRRRLNHICFWLLNSARVCWRRNRCGVLISEHLWGVLPEVLRGALAASLFVASDGCPSFVGGWG